MANRRTGAAALALLCTAVPTASAAAAETIRYVYDARGRLIEVKREQPSVVVTTKYEYDKANNRVQKQVTTTP